MLTIPCPFVQAKYRELVEQLMAQQSSEEMRARIAEAFTALTTDNQIVMEVGRVNKKKFVQNFGELLLKVRGFLLLK